MTVQDKKRLFESEPPAVRERALLRFEGVDGFDVYNCSIPFEFRGRRHIFGRVERRDLWVASRIALFAETGRDCYERVREFEMLQLEDPFVAVVDGEFVLGGTHPQKVGGKISTFFTYFYRGPDPLHLEYFTTGPAFMKDIRLAPLAPGRIGVFSRPRGEDIRARYGSEAIVGYTEISSLDELTPEVVQGAQIVPGLFDKDEWGGCNQCYPLADGRIGVAAHLCCPGPVALNGVPRQIYCNAAFVFDPATRTATAPWIVATRSMHASAPNKVPHLDDCAFTSGFDFRPDGLVDIYSGLGDTAEGRITIDGTDFWDGTKAISGDLAAKWDAALTANPPEEYAAAFLAPDRIEEHSRMAHLRPDCREPLLAMAGRVLADNWLLTLAAYMHWRLFVDRDPVGQKRWPEPKPLEGDDAGCFRLLVALGFPPEYTKAQKALGIPDDVISETCRQVACFAHNFHFATGKAGVFPGQLSWLHVYFPPNHYYRLGRLEFQSFIFSSHFKVFRRKTDGKTCALCLPGQKYRANGDACFSDCDLPADAWQPAIDERDDGVSGHPVDQDGRASRETVFLPYAEWECALAPGDHVLFMHIPAGGGMAPDLVRDSLRRALPFFDQHFPRITAKAIICSSWIFSNQLSECLPPDSNILALQRMVHLLPLSAPKMAGLWFLFLVQPPFDVATLPRDTSMRRAMADWLTAGNVFHAGEMYLLRGEEVPQAADNR